MITVAPWQHTVCSYYLLTFISHLLFWNSAKEPLYIYFNNSYWPAFRISSCVSVNDICWETVAAAAAASHWLHILILYFSGLSTTLDYWKGPAVEFDNLWSDPTGLLCFCADTVISLYLFSLSLFCSFSGILHLWMNGSWPWEVFQHNKIYQCWFVCAIFQ